MVSKFFSKTHPDAPAFRAFVASRIAHLAQVGDPHDTKGFTVIQTRRADRDGLTDATEIFQGIADGNRANWLRLFLDGSYNKRAAYSVWQSVLSAQANHLAQFGAVYVALETNANYDQIRRAWLKLPTDTQHSVNLALHQAIVDEFRYYRAENTVTV